MSTHDYTIMISKEKEGGYSGRCLELPAAISQGETIEELRKNMSEAIQLVLEHIKEKSLLFQKQQQNSGNIRIETITI